MDSLTTFHYRKRLYLDQLLPDQRQFAEALIAKTLALLKAETLPAETLATIVALSHLQGH